MFETDDEAIRNLVILAKEGVVTQAVVDSEYNRVEGGYWAITSEGEDIVVNEVNVIGW